MHHRTPPGGRTAQQRTHPVAGRREARVPLGQEQLGERVGGGEPVTARDPGPLRLLLRTLEQRRRRRTVRPDVAAARADEQHDRVVPPRRRQRLAQLLDRRGPVAQHQLEPVLLDQEQGERGVVPAAGVYHRAQRVGRGEGAGGDPVQPVRPLGVAAGDDGAAPRREDGVPPVDGLAVGLGEVVEQQARPHALPQQRRARPLPRQLLRDGRIQRAAGRRRHDEVGERRAQAVEDLLGDVLGEQGVGPVCAGDTRDERHPHRGGPAGRLAPELRGLRGGHRPAQRRGRRAHLARGEGQVVAADLAELACRPEWLQRDGGRLPTGEDEVHGRRSVRDEHAEDAVPSVGAGPVHVVDHEHGGFRYLVECAHGRGRARVHVARVEAQGQQRCVAGVVDVPGEPAQGGDDPVVQLPGVDVEVVEGEPGRRAAPSPGPLGERGGLAEPCGRGHDRDPVARDGGVEQRGEARPLDGGVDPAAAVSPGTTATAPSPSPTRSPSPRR